jgi:hypothetical protein
LAPLIEDKDFFKEHALKTLMSFFYEISYELRKVVCGGCKDIFNGIVLNRNLSLMPEQEQDPLESSPELDTTHSYSEQSPESKNNMNFLRD